MEGDLSVLVQGDVGAPGEDLTAGNATGCPHGGVQWWWHVSLPQA